MKINYLQTYDCSLDAFKAALAVADNHSKVHSAMGATQMRISEQQGDEESLFFTLDYHQALGVPLPGFAKKIIGETMPVMHSERWDFQRGEGEIELVTSLPGSIKGRMRLQADGARCQRSYDWDIAIKLPLVGGKLEKLMADAMRKKDPQEVAAWNEILA